MQYTDLNGSDVDYGGGVAGIGAGDYLNGSGWGIAQGLGSFAGGIMGYFGQKETNETNMKLAANATDFNERQAALNRAFQAYMSNTSWQRGIADMRAAGINPILAASKGGASTPGGDSASAVTPTVENSMKFLGDSVKGSLSSAVQVMRDVKSLEAADAQIAGQKAQALTSVAMANNANASARATDAGLASIKEKARSAASEADAAIAEGALRKRTAEINKTMAPYDAAVSRVLQAIGGVSDATSIGRQLQRSYIDQRDSSQRNDRHILDMRRGVPARKLP